MVNAVLEQSALTKLPRGLSVSGRLPEQHRGNRGVTELRRDGLQPPLVPDPPKLCLTAACGLRFRTTVTGNAASNSLRCFCFAKLHTRQFVKRLLLPGTKTTLSFHLRYSAMALPQFPLRLARQG